MTTHIAVQHGILALEHFPPFGGRAYASRDVLCEHGHLSLPIALNKES